MILKTQRKYKWVKIAGQIGELIFSENNIAPIEVKGKKICIAKTILGIKAFAAKCPHAGGNMSEGKLDSKGNIVCPVHGYRFSIHNGRDSNGEGYFLKMYPVKEAEDGIFVGIEEEVFL